MNRITRYMLINFIKYVIKSCATPSLVSSWAHSALKRSLMQLALFGIYLETGKERNEFQKFCLRDCKPGKPVNGMNSSRSSHEINGIPHCLVDGFKHRIPANIPFEERCYILTHYHSDHYGGLSSSWRHGRIYCSSITANLIENVMNVASNMIVRVEIGNEIRIKDATVTFLDANHCPGAVILLFKLDTGINHLHTGDMRYYPDMKLYKALQNIKIDKIYLDTTYAHPKHTFMSQDSSIHKIVTLAREFLLAHPNDGIIYMSAYNLGKERIIFALSDALNVPIYMDADKLHIMNQIPKGYERVSTGKFVCNPRLAKVHICRMGFLGTLFPFFKGNFQGIRQHVEELNTNHTEADGVRHYLNTSHCPMPLILQNNQENEIKPSQIRAALAFIPTGWADSGNFNKTHQMLREDNITIHSVPYSEHSNCPELVEFVKFLKPKEVVPTVYSDERNRLFILELFRNCVDRAGNLRSFLAKFKSSPALPATTTASSRSGEKSCNTEKQGTGSLKLPSAPLIDLCDSANENDTPTPSHTSRSPRDAGNEVTVKRARTELEETAAAVGRDSSSREQQERLKETAQQTATLQQAADTDAWSCQYCTYLHTGPGCSLYLQCDLCGALRHTSSVV